MSDTNLGPMKDAYNRLYSSGKVYYVIENDPASSSFKKTTARAEIQNAFLCWQRASSFVFEEIPEAQRSATYPSFFPRINLRFGTCTSTLHSAETSFDGNLEGNPRLIVFNNNTTWEAMREKEYSIISGLFGFPPIMAAATVNDLWTMALHEIGHALGLTHNESNQSIMYKWDIWDDPTGVVMVEGGVPMVDAIALAKLYNIPSEAVVALPPNAGNYLIVGGKFVMFESKAMNTMPYTQPETVWGIQKGHLVKAGEGFCISPTVGANHKGYGILYFYLLEKDQVEPKAFVATGGFQMEAADSFQWPAPRFDRCRARIVAGTKDKYKWGGDWGIAKGGTDQVIAHFYSQAYPVEMNYRVMALTLKNVGPDGILVSGGMQDIQNQPKIWGVHGNVFYPTEIGRADFLDRGPSSVLSLFTNHQ
ncbi:matrixin family metalloprotease [Phyllobacterium lublinensis]|uniref:matrixin family metalloprotease n=1 Tax=Phyllobacterium lublinensis TaxID=2875708 RepID=UPI001CCABA0B|nr:matrixin family metalloprotease [Phyllobacterium sp. 2063]MBZ9656357.1 matrixin family metalloprotease [Phyllobacterium sp. 2063]